MFRPHLTLLCLLLLPSCTGFPEISRFGPESGPPPALLPLDEILARADGGGQDPGPAVAARAAALKARAAALTAAAP